MTLRRNFTVEDERKVRIKIITLTITLAMVIVLIARTFSNVPKPVGVNIINIKMLNENQIIIDNDTTNYDGFASTLKQAVILAKQNHPQNKILLSVPTSGTSKEISDVIMVVTAMNLNWQIKN